MPDPTKDPTAIADEFDTRWWRQLAISGQVIVIALPILYIAESRVDGPPMWAIGLAVGSVLAGLVGSFLNWRCPACSTYFGKRVFGLRHCPSCGVALVRS